jgi:hypothetical protein
MAPKSRSRAKRRGPQARRKDPAWSAQIWDLHLPVLSLRRGAGAYETKKPIIYGTAFPVGDGLFVTADHVVKDAAADGALALSVLSGAGRMIQPFLADYIERVAGIDLAVIKCAALRHLNCVSVDFDRPLGLLAPVSAVGFPLALDPQFVTVSPRAFGGVVVTRRRLFHLPGQPPGYEVSFFAPQGLSGAPLVSVAHGAPRCYGVVIQQASIGAGSEVTPVGIAVGIEALLSVVDGSTGRPFASFFGREHVPARRPVESPFTTIAAPLEGWPDDDDLPIPTDT